MGDDLGVRLKNRDPDATAYVPAHASYWDNTTDLIEEVIENLARQGFFEGILTSPQLSRTNMVVSYATFQCVTLDGVYCALLASSVTHGTADATNPRIDIICVAPTVQMSGAEVVRTGAVVITEGTPAAKPLVPETPSNYLKIGEVDVPAGATQVTLRAWKPVYAQIAMFRPFAQDTPDMTVKVNFGRAYISGNTLVDKDVQNSPSFTAPAANKCCIDILHIDSSGTLAITGGTEVDLPNEPSAPTYPTDKLVICEVYLEAGDTAIYQWRIKDVRPFLHLGLGLRNVVEDTTPQLGGDLDAQTKRIYDVKWLDLKAPTELTIATGVITITQSFHTVDTEADGPSDDLVTINGGSVGRVLILRAENDARTVVVKHATGNIWLKDKADISLDDLEDSLILLYTAGSKWVDIGPGAAAVATTFLALTDSPVDYTDDALKYVRVNASENALEFDEATIGFSFAIPIDTPETVGNDKGVFHFAPGVAGTIEEVYLMAKTAPGAGKTLTVDVHKAGTTIFTTQENRPSLVDTAKTDTSGTPDVTTFAKNDLFEIDVDVSTAETAVADVILYVRGKQKVA